MKKIITGVLLTAVICILCCRCAAKDILPQFSGYSGRCDLSLAGGECSLLISSGEAGTFSAEIIAPAELEGMKAEWSADGFRLFYMGMEWQEPSGRFPAGAAASAVRNVFISAAGAASPAKPTSDGVYILEGNCESGDYKLSLNEDGSPSGLSIPGMGINAKFS